jgi:hypothetical protein
VKPHIKLGPEIICLSLFALVLSSLFCTKGTARSWFREQDINNTQGLDIDLSGTYQYSSIRGYMQTPRGGEPGTTSEKRPTFKELDFDRVSSIYSFLRIGNNRNNFYGCIQLVHLSGDAALDNELISQGVTYPAGSNVSSDIKLDLYRFGYQYRFFSKNSGQPNFEIDPTIEIAFFDFHYKLDASGGLSTDRSYVKGACRIGTDVHWYANDELTLSASVIGPVPISNTPRIWTLELTARYQLWGHGHRGGAALVGLGYQHIEYEDNQTVPNHIKVEMSPMLRASVQIGF